MIGGAKGFTVVIARYNEKDKVPVHKAAVRRWYISHLFLLYGAILEALTRCWPSCPSLPPKSLSLWQPHRCLKYLHWNLSLNCYNVVEKEEGGEEWEGAELNS